MAKDGTKDIITKPLSLLLAEGATEKIFYALIDKKYFPRLNIKIVDVHGRGSVLREALAKSQFPFIKPKNCKVRIYCCVDNENVYHVAPDFDLESIREACKTDKLTNILSVDAIVANQMTESWFFYDLDGIYDFLEVPENKRKPKPKYNNPKKCTKRDLRKLFKAYGSHYHEGRRAKDFIKSLDIAKIKANCKELSQGIELIKSQAEDLTNHLSPVKKRKR